MQIKTILNRIEKHRSFVYGKVKWRRIAGQDALLVEIAPRANGQAVCSCCGQRRPGYDTLDTRWFEYVPLWGFLVFFVYAMRRVDCPTCGVVNWGLEHRSLDGITAIGVDEVLWHRGQKYLTLVYQINDGCKRLLWLGKDRTEESFAKFFDMLGDTRCAAIRFVCSDMRKPYLNVIADRAKQALNILDRYHIVAKMNKAIDEVRAKEVKQLKADGYEPVLKHSRWCLLKRPGNLTEHGHRI